MACTRAKWQLHLTATVGAPDEPEELEELDAADGDLDDDAARDPVRRRLTACSALETASGSLLAVLWPVLGSGIRGSRRGSAVGAARIAARGNARRSALPPAGRLGARA